MLVVGNVGMSGRKEFLLGNVPNRVSHNARCTVVIVNTTAAVEPAQTKRRFGAVSGTPGRAQAARPRGRIGRVAGKYGLARARRRPPTSRLRGARAATCATALEELGPTFAKLGQILSTRPDLLPPEFVEELATLQDQVPPLTEAEVVAVMEEELRRAVGGRLREHRPGAARGRDDRPGAPRDARERRARRRQGAAADRARARSCATSACSSCSPRRRRARPALRELIDIPAVLEHLSESLRRELDFRQEAANIERMREVLEPYARLDVPRALPRALDARGCS